MDPDLGSTAGGNRDPESDPFRPPERNCEVICLHCGERYDSYKITRVEKPQKDGGTMGFWCCPTPGCDGAGYGIDIYPYDPDTVDDEDRGMQGGWFDDDGNPCPPPWLAGDE